MYYGKTGCYLHETLISLCLILTVVVSVISVIPKVQEGLDGYSGLFPSSAVSAYAIYVTWSAMSNNPDQTCNPNLLRHLFHTVNVSTDVTVNSTTSMTSDISTTANVDPVSILSIFIWFCCMVFSW